MTSYARGTPFSFSDMFPDFHAPDALPDLLNTAELSGKAERFDEMVC